MAFTADPAQRHRRLSAEFADIIAQVSDWSAPAPVAGWTAADVPAHLIEWLPGVLADATGIQLAPPSVDPRVDPATAWREHADGVQSVLDDEQVAERAIVDGGFTGMRIGEMLNRIYTPDIFMHRWDLARSNNLDPQLDPGLCEELLAGMAGIEQLLRDSGQFGTRVEVPQDAPPADQLIAFIGRNPYWPAQA
jgi:uncharacterized protein (TIGR03086 family)